MSTAYRLVKRLSSEIVVLACPEFGQAMFTAERLRKDRQCETCHAPMARGTRAFRPITNGNNRMHRLCARCAKGGR